VEPGHGYRATGDAVMVNMGNGRTWREKFNLNQKRLKPTLRCKKAGSNILRYDATYLLMQLPGIGVILY
jgi:hypothetical protein